MMHWRIPLNQIHFDEADHSAVKEVMTSGWLSTGPRTAQFEAEFARYIGSPGAVAVSSGTAALHLSLLAAGVGSGDEVIMPSLSFVAAANIVRQLGAIPVFVDVGSENDLNMDCQSVERAVTNRTKCIVVMHYGGYACDMAALCTIAQRRSLTLIEDAAHALGGSIDGRKLGTFGDFGCFSFFANKNLTVGEGGMVVTRRDPQLLTQLRSHGLTTATWDRHRTTNLMSYDVETPGLNYRIDEIRAALGCTQLHKLERHNYARRNTSELYRNLISEHGDISAPFSSRIGETAAHLFPVMVPPDVDRDRTRLNMHQRGVQTSVHYKPIHTLLAHRTSISLPCTESVAQRLITLPLHPHMTRSDTEYVMASLLLSMRAV